MEMPKPGDAHKKLAPFIGEWSGPETMHPSPWDPAGGTATGHVTNRWVTDGFAVVQEYEQRRGGKVTFRGHGVFWFDPGKQEYVMTWWDSMGGTPNEFRGQFDGNALLLTSPNPQGGFSRAAWSLTGSGSHTFSMDVSPDGQTWKPSMEGRYRKVAVKKAAANKPVKRAAKAATARKSKKSKKR
jgi:hypothetical protein